MQNKLKIDYNAFDRELSVSDSYGPSIIVCNFITCQKLLEGAECKGLYNYKGHDIYIDSNLWDDEYMIFPIINIEKAKERLNWRRYQREVEYVE